MDCTYCSKNLPTDSAVCPGCSFPAQGTDGEKYKFLYMKSIPLAAEMTQAEDGTKRSRTAFFVAAGIAFLNALLVISGILPENIYHSYVNVIAAVLLAVIGVVFILLGVFLRKHPLAASLIGFILALIFFHRSILGVIIIVVLGYGMWCALKYNSVKRKFDTLSGKMSKYAPE